MESNKVLKIKKKPFITSECWSFYRLAILQTSIYADAWLSSHMDIFFIENQFCAVFGDYSGRNYGIDYFNDILKYEKIEMKNYSYIEFCNMLFCEINSNNYVVLDLNFSYLSCDREDKFKLHENLIYGYDKQKEIFYSFTLKSNGEFVDVELGFDEVYKSYNSIYRYYRDVENGRQRIDRMYNNYGITRIKICETYDDTKDSHLFIEKIKRELNGSFVVKKYYTLDKDNILEEVDNGIYTGTACLMGLKKKMKQIANVGLDKTIDLKHYINSLKKLDEHRKILLNSMNWFYNKNALNYPERNHLKTIINEYEQCTEKFEKLRIELMKIGLKNEWIIESKKSMIIY